MEFSLKSKVLCPLSTMPKFSVGQRFENYTANQTLPIERNSFTAKNQTLRSYSVYIFA